MTANSLGPQCSSSKTSGRGRGAGCPAGSERAPSSPDPLACRLRGRRLRTPRPRGQAPGSPLTSPAACRGRAGFRLCSAPPPPASGLPFAPVQRAPGPTRRVPPLPARWGFWSQPGRAERTARRPPARGEAGAWPSKEKAIPGGGARSCGPSAPASRLKEARRVPGRRWHAGAGQCRPAALGWLGGCARTRVRGLRRTLRFLL